MKKNKGRFQTVKIADLYRAEYQRETIERRIRQLAREWDHEKYRHIVVSIRDGKQWVLDGWHRVRAAERVGISELGAQVYEGLTIEDEARLFRLQSRICKRVTPIEEHRAALIEGDPIAIGIENIAEEIGLRITEGGGGMTTPVLNCVNTLRTLYSAGDYKTNQRTLSLVQYFKDEKFPMSPPDMLRTTLHAIKEMWSCDKKSRTGHFIIGVHRFLCEVVRQKKDMVDALEKIGGKSSLYYLQQANMIVETETRGVQLAVYIALVRQYNHNRRSKKMKIDSAE